jgi:hypothetical protein
MGTACKEGSHIGIIPRAMATLFDKIDKLKNQVEFQLRVSFIEVNYLFLDESNICGIVENPIVLVLLIDSERRGEGFA